MAQNNRLIQARKTRGWTQKRLAEELGVVESTVIRWEKGERLPYPYYRRKLTALFGATEEALGLLPGEQKDPPPDALVDSLIPLSSEAPLVGRDQELARLRQRLVGGSTLVFHGLPGVGKTTLAVALAHNPEVRAHFTDGILWAGLGPEPNVQSHLSRWGTLLGLSSGEMNNLKSTKAWSTALHRAIGSRAILLVIDDAWTPEEALPFMVGGPACAHLVTTRFPSLAGRVLANGSAAIPELSDDEGLELLRMLAPVAVEREAQRVKELARSVGGLPLALTLMGNYLRMQSYTGQTRRISVALQRLSEASERLQISEPRGPTEQHPSLASNAMSLRAIFDVFLQRLSNVAQEALAALSLFPAKPNSFAEGAALAVAGCSLDNLDALIDAGLVEHNGPDRYALHQTVADYASSNQELSHGREGAVARFVEYYAGYAEAQRTNHATIALEEKNLMAALHLADSHREGALFRLVVALFPYWQARGLYEVAEQELRPAELAARRTGKRDIWAQILAHRGEIAQKRGRYTEAIALCEEGLVLARQMGRHDLVASLLATLGWVRTSQGEYEQGELLLQEGLELSRQYTDARVRLHLLNGLGAIALSRAEYARGLALYQEGLELARQVKDREQESVMLTGVGVMLDNLSKYDVAQTALQEALAIAQALGLRERISINLLNLSAIAKDLGDFALSDTYRLEALELAEQMGHSELQIILLSGLGKSALERGNHAQAEKYLQESLSLARQVGYRDRISEVLEPLSALARFRGEYEQAHMYVQEGFTLARETGRREDLMRLHVQQARLAQAQGEYTQAEAILQTAVEQSRQIGDLYEINRILLALGEVLLAMKEYAKAEAVFREVQQRGEQKLLHAFALFGLAQALAARSQLDDAREFAEQSLLLFEERGIADAENVRRFLQSLTHHSPD